jgi:hypothetical protein
VFDIAVMGPVNTSLGGPYNLITAGTKTADIANSISVIGEVVNFADSIAAQSLSIDDGGFLGFSSYPYSTVLYAGTLDVGGNLTQGGTETGGTFDVSDGFFEDANGTIDGRGTLAALGEFEFGTWVNTGALTIEGQSATLSLYDGTLEGGPAGVLVTSGATLSDSGATIATAITLAAGTLIGTSATLASGLVLDGMANVIGGGNFTLGSIMDGAIAGGFTAEASSLGGVIKLRGSNSFSAGVTLASGTLELSGAGAAGSGPIAFAPSATATLRIDSGAVPSNVIEGFALGDTITLPFIPYDETLSLSEAGGIVTLCEGQTIEAQLTFAGSDTILTPLLGLDASGEAELFATSPTLVQTTGMAGDWTSAAVWASGLVPSAANDVDLAATSAGAISVTGTHSAANVVDSSGANLTIGLGSTLSVAGDVVVDGGTLTVLGQLSDVALVLNEATLALQSTTLPPSNYYYVSNIKNYGLIAMRGGEIDLTGTASAALSLSEMGGGLVVLNGAGTGYLSADLLQPGGVFAAGNVSVSGAASTVFVESGTLYGAASASTVVFAGGVNAELVMPASETPGSISDITAAVAPGGGNDTVLANSGMGTIFGGSGTMTFTGVVSSDEDDPDNYIFPVVPYAALVVGGSGSLIAYGAMNTQNPEFYRYGTNMFFGGSAGGNILVSGDGASTLVGGGTGDQLYANGTASVILVAGAGNETLTGAGSTGGNVFYGGSGNDLMIAGGGNDTVVAGAGAQTIFGGNSSPTVILAGSGQDVILAGASADYVEAGSGSALVFAGANDIFAAINGQAGGELAIVGFNTSNDFIQLQGYASTVVATALAGATVAGGSTQLTLPDATKLVLYGVTNLTAASFI